MPPAIPASLVVDLTRDSSRAAAVHYSKAPRQSQPGPRIPVAVPVDILSVARLNSGTKVQFITKGEMRRESSKQQSSSSNGSAVRKPTPDSVKTGVPGNTKAVFLPDINSGRHVSTVYTKKSPLTVPREVSAGQRPSQVSSSHTSRPSSSKHHSTGSLDRHSSRPVERSSASGREKNHHRSEASLPDGDAGGGHRSPSGHSHHQSDRHSTNSSPKVQLAHPIHVAERPSSSSSAGSSKHTKSSSSKHKSRSRGDFEQNSHFSSVPSLASPFVSPYSLPLMAGFSQDNLYMNMPGAGFSFPPESLAAFFGSPGAHKERFLYKKI